MDSPSIFSGYSMTAQPIFSAPATPSNLIIHSTDTGEPLVTISLKDGSIEFGPNYTPDEAARIFWEAITEGFLSSRFS